MLKKVVALKNLQDSVSELEAEYKKERIALEAKYRDLKIPFFEKRFQIISGAVEVPDDPDAPGMCYEA
jgi:nucleosome assembly protein 1-like 1